MRLVDVLCAAVAVAGLTAPALALDWDETVDGDLSGDFANPTDIGMLSLGGNSVTGTSGFANFPPPVGDVDYWSFTVPDALELSEVVLTNYAGDDFSFAAIINAAAFPFDNQSGEGQTGLLTGATVFSSGAADGSPDQIGTDILDNLLAGDNFSDLITIPVNDEGLTIPLPSGTYSFWAQETSGNVIDYTFTFVVTPAPGAAGLLGHLRT